MASDDTWNLQGLSREARDAAREAARRRGVPFEQWVQSAILDSARGGRGPADNRAGARRPGAEPGRGRDDDGLTAVHALHGRMDDLREQLDRLTRVASDTAIPTRDTADSGRELAAALRVIEERLAGFGSERAPGPRDVSDDWTRVAPAHDDTQAGTNDFERRIAAVDQALNSLNPEPGAAATTDEPPRKENFALGLDRAVADIRERQRILDAAENANSLQRQFVGLSQRLSGGALRPAASSSGAAAEVKEQLRQITEELQSWRRSGGLQGALSVLREELAEIGNKLSEAAPRRALDAMEAEVHALAAKLDDNRVRGAESPALTSIERGLEEVRESLRNYAPAEALAAFRDEVRALDRKLEWVEANADRNSLQQLQQSVAELREVATHAASGDALIALAEEVQGISDKLDHVTDPALGSELLSNLDRRFEALAAELGARTEPGQVTATDAADNLVAIVESLAAKMENLEPSQDSAAALDAIAGQLQRLTERIGSTDARLDHLEQMDRTFAELLDRVDGLRGDAIAAAERAAHDVAMQVVRDNTGFDGETLRQEFDVLRETQSRSDRHTQDTLEVVHDTLERLIDRLAAVETDLRIPVVPLVPSAGERAHESLHTLPDDSEWPPELETLAPPTEAPRRAAPALGPAVPPPERRPIDPSLPADHPLEPGAVRPGRPMASAAERIAASEAALGPAKPAKEPDARANFIAAARRAAQAAANMSPPSEAAAAAPNPEAPASVSLLRRLTGRRMMMVAFAVMVVAGGVQAARKGPAIDIQPARAWLQAHVTQPLTALGRADTPKTKVAAQRPVRTTTIAAPAAVERTVEHLAEADGAPQSLPPQMSETPQSTADAAVAAPQTRSRTAAGVSPFTIASMQKPTTGDVTGSIGRATGLTAAAPGAAPLAIAPAQLSTENAIPAGLQNAATEGNASAAYEVASRYAEGRGTASNMPLAAHWFRQAADKGLAPAQYRLGSLYEKGQGIKKDLDLARQLYRAAADQGHGKAMHNLAVLYSEGVDGKPDFNAAADWFRKAATHGVADSQYNLGILYARGLGVEQSYAESYKWFALAAEHGDADAGRKRDEVATHLGPETLEAAKQTVKSFKAEPQPEAAVNVKAPPGGWESLSPAAAIKPGPRHGARGKVGAL